MMQSLNVTHSGTSSQANVGRYDECLSAHGLTQYLYVTAQDDEIDRKGIVNVQSIRRIHGNRNGNGPRIAKCIYDYFRR